MTLVTAIKLYFENWINFKTRSSRAEFWYAILGLIIISVVFGLLLIITLSIVGALFAWSPDRVANMTDILMLPYQIFTMIASIALVVRRLHDLNKSGWWYLIYFTLIGIPVLIYWYCKKGDAGVNRFGNDPLAET